ncbi:filamentous hemagglutinin N-terminal domain-containing protein [Calothrix sp. FACHB-156]|nr:filamentous hemagglutinin N-terminal domain-containing protein [Calothrix sp. FACHB-156]
MNTNHKADCYLLQLFRLLATVGLTVAGGNQAIAQIQPDRTLGSEQSVVVPSNANIQELPAASIDLIKGGATRGTNLFHSFLEFNVQEGRGVYFHNPIGITDILARVTGKSPSEILGRLGVLGNANLFLVNPSGIVFGKNASLDVQGSFLATTANTIKLGENGYFSASEPQKSSLLSVSVGALFFNQVANQPSSIVNAGNLAVGTGQNLTLVGGTVVTNGQLLASGGEISVAAVPSHSQVQLGTKGQFLSLSPLSMPATTIHPPSLPTLLQTVDSDTGLTVTDNGQVKLTASQTKIPIAEGTVIVSGDLDASNPAVGKTGGTVKILGDRVALVDQAQINVSGDRAGGTALIGGNFSGQGNLPNATHTYVSPNVTINADALTNGNGGQIIVWADGTTRFYGNISDRGGSLSGNGGFVEVSGKQNLAFDGRVDVSAINGQPGKLLLDPANVVISDYSDQNNELLDGTILATDGGNSTFLLTPFALTAALNSGDVEISATNQISSNNNTFYSLNVRANSANNLTLNAPIIDLNYIVIEQGGGGSIILNATDAVSLTNGAQIRTTANNNVNAGNITINTEKLTLAGQNTAQYDFNNFGERSGVFSEVNQGSIGNGGTITINARSLSVSQGALLSASTQGQGNAGEIIINARDTAAFDGTIITLTLDQSQNTSAVEDNLVASGVFSQVQAGAQGNGSLININTKELTVSNGAQLSAVTNGRGHAGSVIINAQNSATFKGTGPQSVGISQANGSDGNRIIGTTPLRLRPPSGAFSSVRLGAEVTDGVKGNIIINTPLLNVLDGARLTSSTSGIGDAGSVNIQANSVILSGKGANATSPGAVDDFSGGISVLSQAQQGNGGSIDINTRNLQVSEGIVIASLTRGNGNAGSVTINATDSAAFDQSFILSEVQPTGIGNGGEINVTTGTFSLTNGAQLRVSSAGQGNAGNVLVNADQLFLSGRDSNSQSSSLLSETSATSAAGGLSLKPYLTTNLAINLADNARISASTAGSGLGGTLTVTAPQSVTLSGNGQLAVETSNSGQAGKAIVNTPQLTVQNGAKITANSRLSGSVGGDISLQNLETLLLNNGEISAATVDGIAGSLLINPGQTPANLIQLNHGNLNVKAIATGNSGDLNINASNLNLENDSEISSTTNVGTGRNIILQNLKTLQLNNSNISASTQTGKAGNININIQQTPANSIQLSGVDSRIAAEATQAGGEAGSLTINTDNFIIDRKARVTVSSPQGQAGNLNIDANSLSLNNGTITAETGKSGVESGANINLKISNLLNLSNESKISATAFNQANGGNINIDTNFLVALPVQGINGSDIIANAVSGNGGKINLLATGIFGIFPRKAMIGDRTNDIDASSEFGSAGVIAINTPDVGVENSLSQLSANFVNPEQAIAGSCIARRNVQQGSFTVTGNGGKPLTPYEPILGKYQLTTLQSIGNIDSSTNPQNSKLQPQTTSWKLGDPVVEAQSMNVTPEGRIVIGTTTQLLAIAKAKDLVCQ